jgi:hypothetical protein
MITVTVVNVPPVPPGNTIASPISAKAYASGPSLATFPGSGAGTLLKMTESSPKAGVARTAAITPSIAPNN